MVVGQVESLPVEAAAAHRCLAQRATPLGAPPGEVGGFDGDHLGDRQRVDRDVDTAAETELEHPAVQAQAGLATQAEHGGLVGAELDEPWRHLLCPPTHRPRVGQPRRRVMIGTSGGASTRTGGPQAPAPRVVKTGTSPTITNPSRVGCWRVTA